MIHLSVGLSYDDDHAYATKMKCRDNDVFTNRRPSKFWTYKRPHRSPTNSDTPLHILDGALRFGHISDAFLFPHTSSHYSSQSASAVSNFHPITKIVNPNSEATSSLLSIVSSRYKLQRTEIYMYEDDHLLILHRNQRIKINLYRLE
ncbi:uncharacterized protein LOC113312065 [Papaver somniferum]|uniref:uncharacterized protein LOC113312065 n=1 Tax=Papaver somniferum TaxID=3469 RepID=UPI000E6FD046|nr:uncharacterized protein LOC113312065 [Papaver somniferum]